jgi:hypothetical protein
LAGQVTKMGTKRHTGHQQGSPKERERRSLCQEEDDDALDLEAVG